jgi:hypothetical protein
LCCYGQQFHHFPVISYLIFAVVNKKTDQPPDYFDFQLFWYGCNYQLAKKKSALPGLAMLMKKRKIIGCNELQGLIFEFNHPTFFSPLNIFINTGFTGSNKMIAG